MDTPRGKVAKQLGAYYTARPIADFLVGWAVRQAEDKVIDPSFGGGVFLEAANQRLEYLGGNAGAIYGIELDTNTHAQVSLELHSKSGINPHQLLQADFFDIEAKHVPKMDAVVGNPPFIRYQGFKSKEKALHQVQRQGVYLNHLSSSWAAFLIHATSFLKKGGRLAMIAPSELAHAPYAKPVLEYLFKSFGDVTLVTFETPLFPKLNQETILVLADKKGSHSSNIILQHTETIESLSKSTIKTTETIQARELLENHYPLSFYTLPKETRELYQTLKQSSLVQHLGAIANVSIGYVTGSNDFFHLSKAQVKRWKLNKHYLKHAVYKAKAFQGLAFNKTDWQYAEKHGNAGYLLYLRNQAISQELRDYLEQGKKENVHTAYKCRIRKAWYKVPHVYEADAFLSYMSGQRALLVANPSKAVAPNALHLVRLKTNVITAKDLSALWQNSLTMLSTEIEGHALGGGMLKLEPSEAKKVLIPNIQKISAPFRKKLDGLLRQGQIGKALELGNKTLLIKGLGVSADDVALLANAASHLQQHRNR